MCPVASVVLAEPILSPAAFAPGQRSAGLYCVGCCVGLVGQSASFFACTNIVLSAFAVSLEIILNPSSSSFSKLSLLS